MMGIKELIVLALGCCKKVAMPITIQVWNEFKINGFFMNI